MHGEPRFPLGRILATPGVLESVSQPELLDAVARHASGDWGIVDDDDRRANDVALRSGERLLSAYVTATGGTKFWIITEADRSTTTVLLPDEY